ncbi:uncharacterized protein LOC126693333 isoform X1 [Quercus robur]|uniref:uncharacterized protein LOC126693333 isoform X1 n=1 Tax=Quercus robur TaxID=38942 RepID=UPI0021617FF7|nr:uncharacterized protein LOC126693333 isoform X1 [Quercus robur]XP_050245233.1 uncharacterized protein LOC126693333 isoform X1 [Quercus robur]
MPHRTRPMTALLVFTGLNVALVSTITPVYDFVCFLPYWERRVNIRVLASPNTISSYHLSAKGKLTFFWAKKGQFDLKRGEGGIINALPVRGEYQHRVIIMG